MLGTVRIYITIREPADVAGWPRLAHKQRSNVCDVLTSLSLSLQASIAHYGARLSIVPQNSCASSARKRDSHEREVQPTNQNSDLVCSLIYMYTCNRAALRSAVPCRRIVEWRYRAYAVDPSTVQPCRIWIYIRPSSSAQAVRFLPPFFSSKRNKSREIVLTPVLPSRLTSRPDMQRSFLTIVSPIMVSTSGFALPSAGDTALNVHIP